MAAQAKRELRAAGLQRQRCFEVRRALEESGRLMNVIELSMATGRSPGIVRLALKEMESVEKIGTQYRLKEEEV